MNVKRYLVTVCVVSMLAAAATAAPAEEQATPAAPGEFSGSPALPVPPKPAPVKKKRVLKRGDQGEKPTVEQVIEILEEGGDLSGKDLRGLNLDRKSVV